MSDDRAAGPTPRAPGLPLDRVVAALARAVADEPLLAAVWPGEPALAGLAGLLRRAAGGPPSPGGPPEVVPGLGHGGFSLLASHLVDVLDALGVDDEAGAALLTGLAARRGRVVDTTVGTGGPSTACPGQELRSGPGGPGGLGPGRSAGPGGDVRPHRQGAES